MPFITSENRHKTDAIGPVEVGDRCFLHYRKMLRAWRASPRWTTAHEIYRDMVLGHKVPLATDFHEVEEYTAVNLAWQVFFIKHVWPYEQMKCTLNGEIDY